jgi:SAM-dependent methyltransferase
MLRLFAPPTRLNKPIPKEQATMTSSTAQFNAQAAHYAHSHVHRFGPSLPVLLQLASSTPQDQALDIATGTGNTAITLAPHVASIIGVDMAANMLAEGQKRANQEQIGNVSFEEANAEALPFSNEHFDLVVSRHAPHHFRNALVFLREVARVLRPNGRFVLADQITLLPQQQAWVDEYQRTRDPSHFTQRTRQQWCDLAAQAGLVVVAEQLVTYRLEFDTWTTQAGCSAEQREQLHQLLKIAPTGIEWEQRPNGTPLAHQEPIWVARFERQTQ